MQIGSSLSLVAQGSLAVAATRTNGPEPQPLDGSKDSSGIEKLSEAAGKNGASAEESLSQLKIFFRLEQASGVPIDPAMKFRIVDDNADAIFADLEARLDALPKQPGATTYASREDAMELFEDLEVMAWALETSTTQLAEKGDGPALQIAPSQSDQTLSLFVDINDRQLASDRDANREPFGQISLGPFKGIEDFAQQLRTSPESVRGPIDALANRDDSLSLAGRGLRLLADAVTVLEDNPQLVPNGKEGLALQSLENVMTSFMASANALAKLEARDDPVLSGRGVTFGIDLRF